MTLPTWPLSVNTGVKAGSYREEIENNADSFATDHGPPLENVATFVPTMLCSFEMSGTPAEYAAIVAFWRTTLKSGMLQFRRTHPLTGVMNEIFKFTAPPKLTSGDIYSKYRWTVALRYFPAP